MQMFTFIMIISNNNYNHYDQQYDYDEELQDNEEENCKWLKL